MSRKSGRGVQQGISYQITALSCRLWIGRGVFVFPIRSIPSKDVLLAQLVGSIQGPIQKLAALLQAIVEKNGEAA